MKQYKQRDSVNSIGRLHMHDSQVEYRLQLRAQKYSLFKHSIPYKGRLFFIENFCEHGDLLINPTFFDLVYFKYSNVHELYCDKCREEYYKNNISEKDIEENRNLLKDIYSYSAKLKENYIKYNHFILYECINNNCIEKDISWNEKTFLFKEGLKERPICIFKNCNKKTFFSRSNRRYSYFCEKHNSGFMSKGETELTNFISDNVKNVTKLRLKNQEIDIYVPELNLGFEFNGLYWHNELYKDKKYHYNKWEMCQSQDVQLINIWEDDWQFKTEIVKSIILNKLGKNEHKINGRQCIIKNVSSEDSNIFLDQNHLQGKCQASIRLGLFYKNELVSLMTFGKRNLGKQNNFEMLRFCSKLNTSVIGSASKLFSYFLKNYTFDKVISYANCDISDGGLYKTLNFKEIGHTGVNYWWSDNQNKYHRSKFMKHKIVTDDKSKTEIEIMKEHGFNRIFGTGNLKFEYINKN